MLGGIIGERFGRRPVVLVYCVISLLSSIVSYTAKSYGQLLAGRMLLYMYIGMEGWLVPMFQAEIVPAHMRGSVTVSYVFNHIFGSFIMACVTYKTSNWTTDMCWKLPVALGFILPSISICLIWVMPESPRWLIRRGRDEEALKMLRYMFGSTPDYAPEEELELLKASLAEERERETGSWLSLFRGLNKVRRILSTISRLSRHLRANMFIETHYDCTDDSIPESRHWSGVCEPVRNNLCQVPRHYQPLHIHPYQSRDPMYWSLDHHLHH